MSWILFAIIAYFTNAVNAVIDKFLLRKAIPSPIVYTFYIGLLSIFVLVLIPFGLAWPGIGQLIVAILVGLVFLFSLYAFYAALKKSDASHVVPIVGGITPVVISTLSYVFLEERLRENQLIAFILLVLGSILISIELDKKKRKKSVRGYPIEGFEMAVLAAVSAGIFYVLAKYVFLHQPFISGFIWTRMGSFLGAILMLVFARNRKIILESNKNLKAKSGGLFVFNKALAGGAFIALNYAVSLGSATLINALQGVQFVFLLMIAMILSKKYPKIMEERINHPVLIQKISAIIIIGSGLLILAL